LTNINNLYPSLIRCQQKTKLFSSIKPRGSWANRKKKDRDPSQSCLLEKLAQQLAPYILASNIFYVSVIHLAIAVRMNPPVKKAFVAAIVGPQDCIAAMC